MQRIFNPIRQIGQILYRFRVPILVVLGIALLAVGTTLAFYRTQRGLNVSLASKKSVQVSGPLKIDFSQDIAAGFAAKIEPDVRGTWSEERTVLGVSSVMFEPTGRFEAGHSYSLKFTGVKRAVTGAALPDIKETFTTQLPPGVKTASPATGSKDVPVRPRFTVNLAEPNRGVRDLKAGLVPEAAIKLVSTDDKTFVWEPVAPLKQGEKYTFVLDDMRMAAPEKRRMLNNAFTTVGQPGIASARTGGYFGPGQTLDIVFDQPMEQREDVFKFDVAGKGSWTDDRTYKFAPTAASLKPGTTYTYTVKAGIKSKVGGVLEAERPFQFSTTGAVNATLVPGGEVVPNTAIRVTFDQAVDHASAQAHFGISPAVPGGFSWSGNTMTFTPSGMAYQVAYRFQIAPGVVPAWGLPNARVLAGSFATVPQTIKLAVTGYKTQYRMSCELTSLRMLLGYRGISTNDWEILMRIGYNPRSRDKATNTWDNPNETYVGDLGGYPNSTGYGVHAGPIAAAAKTFGRNATASFNVPASYISARIHEGNPVAFWGHSTPSKPDAWNTSSGVVQTWVSSHARVVFGVVGSPDAPIGFWIIESMTAKPFYWTTAQLMANMNTVPGVSNQVVVVY